MLKFTVGVSDIFRSVGLREWLKFEGDSLVFFRDVAAVTRLFLDVGF